MSTSKQTDFGIAFVVLPPMKRGDVILTERARKGVVAMDWPAARPPGRSPRRRRHRVKEMRDQGRKSNTRTDREVVIPWTERIKSVLLTKGRQY